MIPVPRLSVSALQLMVMATAALILLPLGYVTTLAFSADRVGLAASLDDSCPRTFVQHGVVGRCGGGADPRNRGLDGMDGHPIRVSRTPFLGSRPRTSPGDADIRPRLCVQLSFGIQRSCRTAMANDGGTTSTNCLSAKFLGHHLRDGTRYVSVRVSPHTQRALELQCVL